MLPRVYGIYFYNGLYSQSLILNFCVHGNKMNLLLYMKHSWEASNGCIVILVLGRLL